MFCAFYYMHVKKKKKAQAKGKKYTRTRSLKPSSKFSFRKRDFISLMTDVRNVPQCKDNLVHVLQSPPQQPSRLASQALSRPHSCPGRGLKPEESAVLTACPVVTWPTLSLWFSLAHSWVVAAQEEMADYNLSPLFGQPFVKQRLSFSCLTWEDLFPGILPL